MTKILTREQCEMLLHGLDHRFTKAEKAAIPTLGEILESHEELRLREMNNGNQAKDAIRFLEQGMPAEALQICKEILNRIANSIDITAPTGG